MAGHLMPGAPPPLIGLPPAVSLGPPKLRAQDRPRAADENRGVSDRKAGVTANIALDLCLREDERTFFWCVDGEARQGKEAMAVTILDVEHSPLLEDFPWCWSANPSRARRRDQQERTNHSGLGKHHLPPGPFERPGAVCARAALQHPGSLRTDLRPNTTGRKAVNGWQGPRPHRRARVVQ